MHAEISTDVRNTASQLGLGVPYTVKVLAGRLADDPDTGRPSKLPGVLSMTVDGSMFQDCPDLSVGYIREPDRIEIRHLKPAPPTAELPPGADDQEQGRNRGRSADTAAGAVLVREIADAWHRITRRLQHHAPDSYTALRPGAGPTAIAALESDLGLEVPLELRVLWLLTAGDDGSNGRGCLPGNRALAPLDAVAAVYRLKTHSQAHQDALNTGRPQDERVTVWEPSWIPVVTAGPADRTSGLYLNAATGYLGHWSRSNETQAEEHDTLVTYLEETADKLESPALATRDKPGLTGSTLVWLSSTDPAQDNRWQPLVG